MRMKMSAITIALVCGIALTPVRGAESAPSLGLRAGFEPVTGTGPLSRTFPIWLESRYDVLPEARIVPWVGVGAGLGWTRVSSSDFPLVQGNTTIIVPGVTATESQFNFTLQAGGDVRVSGWFATGPYVAVTQATRQSGTSFQFGLRSTFDL